jgi:adenosylcobinamide-phosphate synthase
LDAVLGDPSTWPHLVRYMGYAITLAEKRRSAPAASPNRQIFFGGVLTALVVGGFSLLSWLALRLGWAVWPPLGWLIALVLSFQCIAAGQLWREAAKAAQPLSTGDLDEARKRLTMIVGRDPSHLDEKGINRALIETVAENLNDGVVAPLFYLALFGPVGAVAYKAVNTLDSMVGYKNQKYLYLGRASARLDDLAGYVPARLSGLLLVGAAFVLGWDAKAAWRVLRKDHAAHKSPNAGWPEAAMAGALGVRLGGPNVYFGKLVDKPWLNPNGTDPDPVHLQGSLRLMAMVSAASTILAALTALFLWWAA